MVTETSTVIKKILPHLNRLGYLVDNMEFEQAVRDEEEHVKGFIDIEIHHKGGPVFLIEAKRDQTKLGAKERQQVLDYAQGRADILFVVVTNGYDFQLYNARTGQRLKINGSILNGVPRRQDLDLVVDTLRKEPQTDNISVTDKPPSYRPGLSEYELRKVFMRCHNRYRKHEGEDKEAFYDFSKIMFLKLLEEKADKEVGQPDGYRAPAGWDRFDELAVLQDPAKVADRIKAMFEKVQADKKYGSVVRSDKFEIQKDETYRDIVAELAKVSFEDCEGDVKGAAFEYFVKYNLRGSSLGQYFTPRAVVRMMVELVDLGSLIPAMAADPANAPRILDPACGSAGFLIIALKKLCEIIDNQSLPSYTAEALKRRVREEVLVGVEKAPSIVRIAKMNMIIAGDGFANIHRGNSLVEEVDCVRIGPGSTPFADIVLTNPPFGIAEGDMDSTVRPLYDVWTSVGQALFLQKMVKVTKPGGTICTVIDETMLNGKQNTEIRKLLLKECFVDAVISLPEVTFKPNYTNVKTSVLLMRRKDSPMRLQTRPIFMYDLREIGYDGTGKPKRGVPSSDDIISQVVKEYRAFEQQHHSEQQPA